MKHSEKAVSFRQIGCRGTHSAILHSALLHIRLQHVTTDKTRLRDDATGIRVTHW